MPDPIVPTQIPNTVVNKSVQELLYAMLQHLAGGGGGGTVGIDQTTPGANTVNTVAVGTPTGRGGSITAGGTAQQLAATNSSRRGFLIQNTSAGDLWINWSGGTAAVGSTTSYRLGATTGAYEFPASYCSTAAISIIGATTGQTWTAEER